MSIDIDRLTEAELIDAYPRLTVADIRAALAYAAETISLEEHLAPAVPNA